MDKELRTRICFKEPLLLLTNKGLNKKPPAKKRLQEIFSQFIISVDKLGQLSIYKSMEFYCNRKTTKKHGIVGFDFAFEM